MGRKQSESIEWLQRITTKSDFSDLGGKVAYFLDTLFGLHHLSTTSLKKVDWNNKNHTEFVYHRSLATVDDNDLTRLVVIAHQMMLRVSIEGIGPGYLRIMFHESTSRNREDGIFKWCPTAIDHVKMIAKYYPDVVSENKDGE